MDIKKLVALSAITALMATACSGSATTPAPATVAPATAAPATAAPASAAPVTAAPSAASPYTWTNGVLQPLADGFPNKALTLLNGDDPGADDGIYARNIQAILTKLSPVAIEVVDRPGPTYGMFTMAEYMNQSAAGKDGYMASVTTYVGGSMDIITAPITRDLGLTIGDINPVNATEKVPWVLIMRADAPWKSFQEMVDYAKANPNTVKYANTSGSGPTIATLALIDKLGIKVKSLVQSGGSTVVASTVAAGAADFGSVVAAIAKVHADTGKVKIVLAYGDQSLTGEFASVPTSKDIGIPGLPWATYRGFAVSKSTPDAHRAWLAELFSKAVQDPLYAQRLTTVPGALAVSLDHQQCVDLMDASIKYAEPIIRALKLAWDQQ